MTKANCKNIVRRANKLGWRIRTCGGRDSKRFTVSGYTKMGGNFLAPNCISNYKVCEWVKAEEKYRRK